MILLKELFTTDIGLLSIAVIVIVVGMAGYYGVFFAKKIREEESQRPQE